VIARGLVETWALDTGVATGGVVGTVLVDVDDVELVEELEVLVLVLVVLVVDVVVVVGGTAAGLVLVVTNSGGPVGLRAGPLTGLFVGVVAVVECVVAARSVARLWIFL
jgi:hypothetical protein